MMRLLDPKPHARRSSSSVAARYSALLLAGAMLLLAALAPAQQPAPAQSTPTSVPAAPAAPLPAVVIQLEDEINDYTRDDLIRRFDEARNQGAKAIILEINSYGGSALAGLETSRFIKQQSDLQVAAFIKEKAISAGALIAVACNSIWMAPHSFIGDSGVIALSAEGIKEVGALERAKMESPVVEDFRDSAQRNGYSPLLLESMVVVGREVYFLENDRHERRLVDKAQYDALSKEGWKPVHPDRNPLDSDTSLLTLNAQTAEDVKLARGIVNSSSDVAARLRWQIAGRLDRTFGDRLIALLAGSTVRGLLITALIVCIYMAVKAPGTGIAEAGVVICLGILLGVPLLTGYAQWWEIFLVLAGVALLALEIFVIPGIGIAGIAGVLFIVVGLIFTFIPKEPVDIPGILPAFEGSYSALRTGLYTVAISMAAGIGLIAILARHLTHLPIFGRLVLTTTVAGGHADGVTLREPKAAHPTVAWLKPGDRGQTLGDLCPGGTALFPDPAGQGDKTVDVLCDSGFIPARTTIVVHEIRGNEVLVRQVT